MAVRKEKIRQQVEDFVRPSLEPGETVEVTLTVMAGRSPWVAYSLFGALGGLGMQPYFVCLTDRRLLFMTASKVSGRPKELADAQPRSGLSVTDHKPRAVWSVVRLRRADGQEQRFNVHRLFRPELGALVGALGP